MCAALPTASKPWTLTVEPHRANERSDSEEPQWVWQITLKFEPNLVKLLTLRVEPMRVKP
jgi:hypothetical protein